MCHRGQTVTLMEQSACSSVCLCSSACVEEACHLRRDRGPKPQLSQHGCVMGREGECGCTQVTVEGSASQASGQPPSEQQRHPNLGASGRDAPDEKRWPTACSQQLQAAAALPEHQLQQQWAIPQVQAGWPPCFFSQQRSVPSPPHPAVQLEKSLASAPDVHHLSD